MSDRHVDERVVDERIETALREALAVEPSAGFLEGARRRALAQPGSRPRPALVGLGLAAGLSSVAAIALLTARWPSGAPVASVAQPTTPPPAVALAPSSTVPPQPAPRPRLGPSPAQRAKRAGGGLPKWPEVIVQPGQEESIRRYQAALSRMPSGAGPPASPQRLQATLEPPPLVTADIEIPELASWPAEAPAGGALPRGNGS